jgi:hypothetical protein
MTWPKLRSWLEVSHEDSQFLDQLLVAANNWNANQKAAGLLWRDDMVAVLHQFLRRYQGKLPAVAETFIAAINRQATRNKRMERARYVVGFAVLSMIAVGATVSAFSINSARADAVRNAQIANEKAREAAENQRIADEQSKQAQAKEKEARDALARMKAAELHADKAEGQVVVRDKLLEQRATQLQRVNKEINEKNERLALTAKALEKERDEAKKAKENAEAAVRRFAERYGILEKDLGNVVAEERRH